MNENISIRFLGGAGAVTGSKYLLSAFRKNILIDCGLFQGLKKLRLINWEPFPVDPASIDFVLLTHGHLDHVGYLPRLVNEGYAGRIWGTSPTLEIARIILEDSAKIQEEEADRANQFGYSKHKNALPLYGLKDVEKTTPLFSSQELEKWIPISDQIQVRFRYNGHIIGATFIELKVGNQTIVFSGDIGRLNDPLLYPPARPEDANILLIESTYGDRIHPVDTEKRLAEIINRSLKKNGTIIIPSFAVERTQSLMYLLWQLQKKKVIPEIPVYMDSPMGRSVLEIFHHNTVWHRLPANECNEMCNRITRVQTMEETLRLAADRKSKIIIAGSGMATGGRVLTYFEHYLGDKTATILLAGYQSEGTRGRQLLEGVDEIKLHGRFYSVKASIENIDGLSAHADQSELIHWLSKLKRSPKHIFITHGEPGAANELRNMIKKKLGWNSFIPQLNEELTFEKTPITST
jgi:metallo-beta-lactamase family protein